MRNSNEDCRQTFAGTICKGMEVFDADDEMIGLVESVEGNQIRLESTNGEKRQFISVSLIDGIHQGKVLLAGRGDASFGLEVEP